MNNRELEKYMVEVRLHARARYDENVTIFQPCWELYYGQAIPPDIAVDMEAGKQGWTKKPQQAT